MTTSPIIRPLHLDARWWWVRMYEHGDPLFPKGASLAVMDNYGTLVPVDLEHAVKEMMKRASNNDEQVPASQTWWTDTRAASTHEARPHCEGGR